MKPIERMNAVLHHQQADRYPWVPSIYEHGARVINRPPADAARSASVMTEAALASYEMYKHDLVTVGIDIYNVEAEAMGCQVSAGDDQSIPGIVSHPLAGQAELNPEVLVVPQPNASNRLGLLVEASGAVASRIGGEVWVNACMGGPFSQAVEVRGFENLIIDMMETPERVHGLLEKTTALAMQQAERLSRAGCGLSIFESWATIPLIPPQTFAEYVVPYNKRIIQMALSKFRTPPPAVIMGGNTARLMDHFIECGTSLVVADFNTDFDFMRKKTAGVPMIVRGCADPKAIERADWPNIQNSVNVLAKKARGMRNFVWGCGAVSYNTRPEDLLRYKRMCSDAEGSF
ncbi:MAG TPA: uroporphyrinogen decarboxylase family protein [Planctomycetota bacterium]|jgi:uroporphyrinogen decarboxylase